MENPRFTRAWKPQSLKKGTRNLVSAALFGENARFAEAWRPILQAAFCKSAFHAFTNWMLPGWQQWMKLDRRCFYKPDVTRLAAMDEARSEMLLQTACYQVGSDGRQPTFVTGTRKCACRVHILCNGVSCYIPPIVARTQMCPNAGRTRVRATKNSSSSPIWLRQTSLVLKLSGASFLSHQNNMWQVMRLPHRMPGNRQQV